MHKHFRVKQWVKACAGIRSCLSFIQRSKIVTLWGRSPAPGPGVLQEQGRGCEQFGQRHHAAEDIFACFITKLPCGLRNWHRLLCHHLCALILGQSEVVVASFLNEQWWRPTQVSQSMFFLPTNLHITDIIITISLSPCPCSNTETIHSF